MELYKEILLKLLDNANVTITIESPEINIDNIIESECYKILKKIKDVMSDDAFNDAECFEKIEKILLLLEEKGITCGSRHDFG